MTVGGEVELDIWINDVPLHLLSAGFWIEYDPSKVRIVNVEVYDWINGPPGPWEVGLTSKIQDPGGPGTYMVTVSPSLVPGPPDGDGDYIIGKVRFRCESEGDAIIIIISTIPGFDTFVGATPITLFDPEITPNTVTIHQIIGDADTDGIPDHEDNCPLDYNTDQEDTYPPGGNGIGDACDCESDLDCDGDVD